MRPKGQILRLSSCYTVNQQNNNFGLHQFLEGPFLTEKQTLSLYAVIANLCQSIYKCPHTHQKMGIQCHRDSLEINLSMNRAVKAVRDMNEVQNDREKHNNPMSMVSVLVFCTSSERLQHSSWLSTMKPSGVRKNS